MGSGGPIALLTSAVTQVFDWLRIDEDERLDIHAQVQFISSVAVDIQHKEAERQRKMEEAKRR